MPSLTDWEDLIERRLAERGPVEQEELNAATAQAALIDRLKHSPEWLEYAGAVHMLKVEADAYALQCQTSLARSTCPQDEADLIRVQWIEALSRARTLQEVLDLVDQLAAPPQSAP